LTVLTEIGGAAKRDAYRTEVLELTTANGKRLYSERRRDGKRGIRGRGFLGEEGGLI
jgi:hypothetical protein